MSAPVEQLTSALAGRYLVEREIGRGGMATVYLARDLRHERRVALKVLSPELGAVLGAERFLSEIRVTAGLQHPNLLPLFDSGELGDGLLYYVMPYVDGESLRARLERERQLPVADAVHIAESVAAALDYAHRRGVIHRDLKPENILVHEGQPLVADFGIALAVSQAGGARITQTGLSLGTPQYMSPEQAAGDRALDGRSDIYSLGAVLYEMLAGEPPHTGATVQAVIARVLTDRPRDVREVRASVPDHVALALDRALAKVPADRFNTAGEFAEALRRPVTVAVPRDVVTPGSVRTLEAPAWRRVRTLHIVAAVSTAAALALAGVVAWQARAYRSARRDASVRFTLASDTIRLPEVDRGVAVSPDGRRIAYVGVIGVGRVLLVRSIDDLRPRAVWGGGVTAVFFSPDSRSIGFVAGTTMLRVAADGGAAAEVARLAVPIYGAAWTPRGEIVFGTPAGLMAVPAAGGAPRPVTRPDSAHGETSQRWPLLLPDGRTIVYESVGRSGTLESAKLGVASLTAGTSTVTDTPGICPLGLAEGQLVFASAAGTLVAAPFDPRRGRVVGEPVPMVDSLAIGGSGCVAAGLSAEGSLAYWRGMPAGDVVAVDARGDARPLLAEPRPYVNVRYSPDGKRIAVTLRSPTAQDVWIHDLASGTLMRLTTEGTLNGVPEWAPDGRRVLWNSNRDPLRSVWWQSADGSGVAEPLLRLPDQAVNAAVLTRDGRRIVYSTSSSGFANLPVGSDVWWRWLPGACAAPSGCDTLAHPIAESRFSETSARPSPDGRWVAYLSDESGHFQVYVRPFPEGGARYQVSTQRAIAPMWSPDGRTLYYVIAEGGQNEIVAATLRTAPDFGVVSRRTVFRARLPVGPTGTSYDVAPDGSHLLVVRRLGIDAIVVVHDWGAELRARLAAASAR